jgi:hypothetical protein
MIPDPCGNAPPHAPRNSSGQIAADRVLHVQRFTLPLQLLAAAAPRSPPTAGRHAGAQPPPATGPRRHGRAAADPGSTEPCPTPGPGPARTGPDRHQARRHGPARPARAARNRSPARPRSRHGSSHPDQSSAQKCDSACSGEPHTVLAAAQYGHDRAISFTEADGRVANSDSAEIPPNTIQHSVTGTTLPMASPDAAPWCSAVLTISGRA